MKIRVINPVPNAIGTSYSKDIARLTEKARSGTDLSFCYIDQGKNSIESAYEDALAVPGTIRAAIKAEQEGMDAIVINCTSDTGLSPIRECVQIPVVAPTISSMYLAAQLAHRFSILTFLERTRVRFEEIAWNCGLSHRLASVRSIEVPLTDIIHGKELVKNLFTIGKICIEIDGAHALIMGCTAFELVSNQLRDVFAQSGIPVQLLDPYSIALHLAEDLVEMGISQSKLTYPFPKAI